MDWYFKVLNNYFVFSGRARRMEYWYFVLFNFLISFALFYVDSLSGFMQQRYGIMIGPLSGLYSLAVLIPYLAVLVRRLHDTGRSAWWLLIYLLPFIGALVIFIFTLLDSEAGSNEYGPNPK